jgi:hypothetical protein
MKKRTIRIDEELNTRINNAIEKMGISLSEFAAPALLRRVELFEEAMEGPPGFDADKFADKFMDWLAIKGAELEEKEKRLS